MSSNERICEIESRFKIVYFSIPSVYKMLFPVNLFGNLGNSNIWGWQIIVADVISSEPGFHKCIQVNRKVYVLLSI
jgi:hypothetical protein